MPNGWSIIFNTPLKESLFFFKILLLPFYLKQSKSAEPINSTILYKPLLLKSENHEHVLGKYCHSFFLEYPFGR